MRVDGLSPEEVEAKARYSGMLVASITPMAAAPVVAYALPEQQKAVSTPQAQAAIQAEPTYAQLQLGAEALRVVGIVIAIAGLICVGLAIVAVAYGDRKDVVVLVFFGLTMIAIGIAAHVFGSFALAMRDVAIGHAIAALERNAQRKSEAPPST